MTVTAADGNRRTYLVRELRGNSIGFPSPSGYGFPEGIRDQRPVYLMGTDLALEGKQAFQWYGGSLVG